MKTIFTSPGYRFELSTQPVLALKVSNHPSQSESITLTNSELQLLKLLLSRPGEVVDRELIQDRVWGNRMVSQGSINQLVSSLRAALAPYSNGHKLVVTVPRQGYFLASADSVHTEPTHSVADTSDKKRILPKWGLAMLLVLPLSAAAWFTSRPTLPPTSQWQQLGALRLLVQPNPYPELDALTQALGDTYQQQSDPLSLVLTPFEDFMLFDCVYHKPAWVRQRQYSVPLSPPSELAESILTLCDAEGGYR